MAGSSEQLQFVPSRPIMSFTSAYNNFGAISYDGPMSLTRAGVSFTPFVLSACISLIACTPDPEWIIEEVDLIPYVNPMIGTAGSGNVIPGALIPHGMVRASPDTLGPASQIGAYHYEHERIEGFSHLHLEGPGGGGNGYSHIRLMPTTGDLQVKPENYASTYSHDTEEAEPGYYAVTLDDYAIRVELTATGHAAVHRYTFGDSGPARLLFDLGYSQGDSRGGDIEIVDDRVVQGYGLYSVHPLIETVMTAVPTALTKVYFYAELDTNIGDHGTWKGRADPVIRQANTTESGAWIGAWGELDVESGEQVLVRIGISLISVEQAALNLSEEIGKKGFDEVQQQARTIWNSRLNRIQAEGDEQVLTTFYTALYHYMFQPADYSEAGGRYSVATSGQARVIEDSERRFFTDDWCMWDTFRTSHPLATIIEPEDRGDVISSMLKMSQQGGWLPKCTWNASGYSRVMIGNHAVSIIADAWTKGLRDFDGDLAWQAMLKVSDSESDTPQTLCGYFNQGTPPDYLSLGYVPQDCDTTQAASMTLEYAYDDWTLAQVAEDLGSAGDHERFLERAGFYANHWDDTTGFMRPRMADGSWMDPFDPGDHSDFNGFAEADSWIYSFFVPHDVPGLVTLMGGEQAFVDKLDRFFDEDHYEQSNQPSFHIPWLYNRAGAPHKTQERVRASLQANYATEPRGLPGNDDAGSTSAWFIFSALGMYPVAPGSGQYDISSPLVDRAVIHLNPAHYEGGTFTIETEGQGIYIQSAKLNGTPLTQPWISHQDMVQGGALVIELGDTPGSW